MRLKKPTYSKRLRVAFDDNDMFSTNDMMPGQDTDNQEVDPRLNEEIQKIKQEVNTASDLNDSSDSIFDSEMDAFEDLQVEVLNSETLRRSK